MKEKLHFIEGDNQQLDQQLQELEAALAGSRDELAGLKATRDKMRQQGRQLKENSVYVSNPMLLQDMQVSCQVHMVCVWELPLVVSWICCMQHDAVNRHASTQL
jgi:hypothetical protein